MLTGRKHTAIDSTFLAELRSGSRTAFDALYELYKNDVYLEANKRLHDPELAKDVTQDVFTGLWLKATQTEIENLPGYLFISIRNKVLRTIQRQDKFVPISDLLQDLIANKERPDQELMYKELLATYETLVNDLPDQQRIIYKMRYTENRSPEEIAEILELSPKTVRNHLGKAVNKLKTSLMLIQIIIYLSEKH
ncbi:sigma-70 family RNA polymerase sigma factor [Pedobacter foliorum]|uniref:sigma-70 family RNA polymerase sigma factor n=1 Tax=Pedobacter foliorum TaxID=2739058 RepID=UPI0015661687|nr:sigma-70 family RNA polymerase sigma factor [Pedobacter foliorum]NRF37577.1 sigma-70 family RNA polymerase sigma factor [Pedobacter foliorum]